jgi:membrane protein YdbS with pleckstrin-like domain
MSNGTVQDVRPIQPGGTLPFTLQDEEKIYAEVKPEMGGFIISRMVGNLIGMVIFLVILLFIFWNFDSIPLDILAVVVVVAIALVSPFISYGKFRYWITNHRVVGQRGFIGYSVESIPLENVTDVTINRGIIEQLLSLSSLYIVPIGGMMMYGRRGGMGGVNYFPALKPDHAVELQALIFKLRDARKREMGKTV